MNFYNYNDICRFEQETQPDLADNTYELISRSASENPDHKAVTFYLQAKDYKKNASWTYRQLMAEINLAANMFRDLGIRDTDVVSYILPNTPETVFTFLGGEAAGIVNPINPLLEPEQMAEIMNEAGTKILVTLAPFPKTDIWEKVSSVLNKVHSLKTVITVDLGKYLGFLPRLVVKAGQKKIRMAGSVSVLDFHQTSRKYSGESLSFQRTIKPEDTASMFHTGGTTGKPKIALHTHRNEVANAWALSQYINLKEYKTFFCGLPWFHVNGVMVTGLAPLSGGHGILLGTPAGYRGEGVIQNFWKTVEYYKISFFSAVPTVLQMLLQVPLKGEDISSLDLALCGASPLSVKLFQDFEEATKLKIIEGYGFTEGSCANAANPPDGERKIGSIGLALPFHLMKTVILDERSGEFIRNAETDEIGNIVCRGLNVFPGYKDDAHNKNIWVNDGEHIWYNTGDLGRRDADHFYWITGRKKELIIRGGHNIDPNSIEEPLSRHPAVAGVAAIGMPDKKSGELPVAYVQLKKGMAATEKELIDFSRQHITEQAAVPKHIFIMDELPLTAIGKIFKPLLSMKTIKKVYEEELLRIPGLPCCTIDVEQDPKLGMKVKITTGMLTEDLRSKIDEAVGGYAVKYEIIELEKV